MEDFTTYTLVNNFPTSYAVEIVTAVHSRYLDTGDELSEFGIYRTFSIPLTLPFWMEARFSRNASGYAHPRFPMAALTNALGYVYTTAGFLALCVTASSNCYASMAASFDNGAITQGVQPPNGGYQRMRWSAVLGTWYVDTFADAARTNLLGTSSVVPTVAVATMTVTHLYALAGNGNTTASGSGGRNIQDFDTAVPLPTGRGGSTTPRRVRMPMLGTRRN